jgi:hypothetical protein
MNTLRQKLNNEMAEFKKSYEAMTPTQIYNDWYIIGFKEEYYDMLMSDFVDWDDYDYIAKWLCEFECPLQFLYNEWLSADGEFDHDWDIMFDFIEEIYRDCMANRH